MALTIPQLQEKLLATKTEQDLKTVILAILFKLKEMETTESRIPKKGLQKVVCAAIMNKKTGLIICGARHYDTIMMKTISELLTSSKQKEWENTEEGFIDQYGSFLTRSEAYHIATQSGQIKPEPNEKPYLISPQLY